LRSDGRGGNRERFPSRAPAIRCRVRPSGERPARAAPNAALSTLARSLPTRAPSSGRHAGPFTLAKTIRDEHESKKIINRIGEAKAVQMLREYGEEA
jgi:hypothetical protein